MKVVDLFRHRVESGFKNHPDFVQWMSPTMRSYIDGILDKANSQSLFARFRALQGPAVNEDVVPEKPIVLPEKAQQLLEELQPQIGQVIHVGDWIDVSQQRINEFGNVTEDCQWLHTDPERAKKESPFKSTIAHGFLTLALLPKLTDSVDPDKPLFPTARMIVNIGLNQVRFPYPVKAGDRIRAKSVLSKITPVRKGLEVEREITIEIEGVKRPAAIVSSVIRLRF